MMLLQINKFSIKVMIRKLILVKLDTQLLQEMDKILSIAFLNKMNSKFIIFTKTKKLHNKYLIH